VNGSVANVSGTEMAFITHSGVLASVDGATGNPNFQMQLPHGARYLVAARMAAPPGAARVMNRGIIRRSVDAASSSTLPVLDFNSAAAFTPAFRNVTIGNLGTDPADIRMIYTTASGMAGVYFFAGVGSLATTRQYPGIPAANQLPGDLHVL
jgi:hypothetical protein